MKAVIIPRTIADKSVAVAGTRVALSATELLVSNLTIQWDPANAGDVYLGDVSVAAGRGITLNASNPQANIVVDNDPTDPNRKVMDVSKWYIDAANNGDQVKLLYLDVESVDYNN